MTVKAVVSRTVRGGFRGATLEVVRTPVIPPDQRRLYDGLAGADTSRPS